MNRDWNWVRGEIMSNSIAALLATGALWLTAAYMNYLKNEARQNEEVIAKERIARERKAMYH